MNAAVLLCAGSSNRMQGENKLLLPIRGLNSIARSLRVLLSAEQIGHVVLVTNETTRPEALHQARLQGGLDRCSVVPGGASRGESVWHGLHALRERRPELVAIHDAARPLLREESLLACLYSARQHGSGIAGIRVVDTLRRTDEEGFGVEDVSREGVWRVLTPQCFRYEEIYRAYVRARENGEDATDDAALYFRSGHRPHMVETRDDNRKITYPADVERAAREVVLQEGSGGMRIGFGEDTHRLVAGRRLVLGGVEIPHDKGLLGHSDADALCHALIDAMLGALALGDIGGCFPDADPAYEGADSLELLRRVYGWIAERGARIVNVDSVITAQRPKLAPHISAIRQRLAKTLELPVSAVSVKAKTGEGVGPEGEERAITVRASVLLEVC